MNVDGWIFSKDDSDRMKHGALERPMVFRKGQLAAIVTRDSAPGDRPRWHISISHATRYPTWEELKSARYALAPDGCYMAQILPPKDEYVNVHPRTFHLWEVDWKP